MQKKENLIKSKSRVQNLGEVFTSEKEVNSITDLIKDLSEKIDSKFLEPSCGNGNFLCEILNRRLLRLKETYKKKMDFEFFLIKATASLYGIDIDKDNIVETKNRMFKSIANYKKNINNEKILKIIKKILDTNILIGDALKENADLFGSGDDLVFVNYTSPKMFYFKKIFYNFNDLKLNIKRPLKSEKITYYLDL